jgi:NAD(P)-dependent dehydrogenase (short-subunit alcohol dehydrogenase family)
MILQQFALDGRVALVTGASRGLGQVFARALAQAGADLIVTARRAEDTAAFVDEIRGLGRCCAGLALDVRDEKSIAEMAARAQEAQGRIDILVNNAGIRARKAFGEFSHEEFDRLVAVNLRAPFFASQAVVPIMRAQGGGHVIHMASQLGLVASRYGAVYNLTKAGLIQLTRSMALELSADGISVNAVCPGPVSTEGFMAGRNPGELEQRARDVPIGRFGTVEEVAGVVAFLVSKDAAYVIGHALVMDGGYITH